MRRAQIVLCLLGLLCLAPVARADSRVKLNNGAEFTGKVADHESDGIWVTTETSRIHVKQADLKSVEKLPDIDLKKAAKQLELPSEIERRQLRQDVRRATHGEKIDAAAAERARAQLSHEIVSALGSDVPSERAKAADRLAAGWPATAYVLDAALAASSQRARIEAVRLLSRTSLTGISTHTLRALRDSSTTVQVLAARVTRHRAIEGAEMALVRMLESVRDWPVHQEALRSLEEIGTIGCLRAVVHGLAGTKDARRRKAYVRVLKAVMSVDHGDDDAAWSRAVLRRIDSGPSPLR